MNSKRFSEYDFKEYLQQLVNLNALDDPALGISKFVLANDYDSLSKNQKFVFDKAIMEGTYYVDQCSRCGNDIPWSEMLFAEDNGNQCSWCSQVGRKD
ncbi:hypothetical protein OC25_23795 [Pedobacter kyungheensis]|uniref:Uncharacterized protein n=1 Tax=Pedobacter kyungheensis TaxID=1069985 RepID=A0A0C1D214_9SPHI|nr:hypothetical protein [Pedobacter kyungheensis]KIA90926.1 hypothetical protein OC25_23795 [Pedobacter kyungheensis]